MEILKLEFVQTVFSCDNGYSFEDGKTSKMYKCIEEKDADDESVGKWRLEGSGVGGPPPEPCYSRLKNSHSDVFTLADTETETETEMDNYSTQWHQYLGAV